MKKLIWLLFAVSAMAQTIQLPLTASQCRPAGSLCGQACLLGVWGPGNGSTCSSSKVLLGQDYTWGCFDSKTLTHIQNTKFCHCEWDYVAAIAISENPAPQCTPNPPSQDFWPYGYYCD